MGAIHNLSSFYRNNAMIAIHSPIIKSFINLSLIDIFKHSRLLLFSGGQGVCSLEQGDFDQAQKRIKV